MPKAVPSYKRKAEFLASGLEHAPQHVFRVHGSLRAAYKDQGLRTGVPQTSAMINQSPFDSFTHRDVSTAASRFGAAELPTVEGLANTYHPSKEVNVPPSKGE